MAQRYCDHTFYKIKDEVEKTAQGEMIPEYQRPRHLAVIGCIFCGQVRHMYSDGTVIIAVEEGKIIKKRNEQPNDTSQKI